MQVSSYVFGVDGNVWKKEGDIPASVMVYLCMNGIYKVYAEKNKCVK